MPGVRGALRKPRRTLRAYRCRGVSRAAGRSTFGADAKPVRTRIWKSPSCARTSKASGSGWKGFECFTAGYGKVTPLPVGAHPAPGLHQVWILEEPARIWRMDILLEPGDTDTWVFRRDETIRRPRSEMVAVSTDGIPYLRPEGVLLYKAKASRPKDEADFASCVPLMDGQACCWLKEALQQTHPGHQWLAALG